MTETVLDRKAVNVCHHKSIMTQLLIKCLKKWKSYDIFPFCWITWDKDIRYKDCTDICVRCTQKYLGMTVLITLRI